MFQAERLPPRNEEAQVNIQFISVTLLVSHALKSASNDTACENIELITRTAAVFH